MKIVFSALRLVNGPNAEENGRFPTGAGTGDEPCGRLPRQMNAYRLCSGTGDYFNVSNNL